ncbi:NAD(P)/FAD-dependent oxidoreductase [uncultured Dysosmobacter sp.]|uniref:NAD(P)/FAD-dependent oxidoreductase n=1 Tax=uncultured Dysosmobacter sp. TaxID=2591384 RepID=UPI0026296251|nr:FAD-dependent oxidoreductase [uncultured Dysosmobacter sp.]
MEYDTLIIGGGPAGCTAALYAARAGLQTPLLTGPELGGQLASAGTVENCPGSAPSSGPDLAAAMLEQARKAGAELRGETAVSLDLSRRTVRTSAGTYQGRTVIYAAGARPRTLDVPGAETLRGRGVSFCAACDGPLFRGRDAAVVGGGNSAVGEALDLSRLCRRVWLVHRRNALRAERRELERLEAAENIMPIWNAEITAILGRDRVTGLSYRDISTGELRQLACDGVFVAIGRLPNTEPLRGQLHLDAAGYVPAGEDTRTELPGVFAAGDVRQKSLRQIVTAAADGAMAAHMAADWLGHQ